MMSESEKEEKIESASSVFGTAGETMVDELEAAGLDLDELEYMDDEERYEALEDAGLDPDDFDF